MQTSERRGDGYVNLALLDRRPARRARAGDHDRRRLPLLPDAAAQVHHRRHPRPRAVHAQHGHRRLDRRPLDRPRRRAQGRLASRPAATPTSPRCCASPTSSCASTRWTSSSYDEDVFYDILEEMTDWAARLADPRHDLHPDLRAARATTSSTAPIGDAVVRRRAAALPPRARRDRARPQPLRRPLPGAVGDPADERRAPRLPRLRRPGGRRRAAPRASEVVVLPGGQRTTVAAIDTYDGEVEAAFPTMSVAVCAWPTSSTSRAAT